MNKYIVFLKQVPSSTKIKMNPKTKTLMRQTGGSCTNPDDLHALDAALWAKSQTGGEVVAVTMGPEKAVETLREAIQRGADRAILLKDMAFAGSDTICTSRVLSAAVKHIGDYTALFFGRMAIDGDTAQVGPEVAALLDIPQVTSLVKINKICSDKVEVVKRVASLTQTLDIQLPCAIMVSKNYGDLASPTLQGWRKSQEAEIAIEDAKSLNIDPLTVGLKASPTRVVKTFTPLNRKSVQRVGSATELADIISNLVTK